MLRISHLIWQILNKKRAEVRIGIGIERCSINMTSLFGTFFLWNVCMILRRRWFRTWSVKRCDPVLDMLRHVIHAAGSDMTRSSTAMTSSIISRVIPTKTFLINSFWTTFCLLCAYTCHKCDLLVFDLDFNNVCSSRWGKDGFDVIQSV